MSKQNQLNWKSRWHLVVSKICPISSQSELIVLLGKLKSVTAPHTLAFANAHAMNMLAENPQFFSAIGTADTVLRDGSGMAILFRALRLNAGLNLNGTDLIPKIIASQNSNRIALYGTRLPYLDLAAKEVRKINPSCNIFKETGFHPATHYLSLAQETKPELIILGMGMPKQELVASLLRNNLTHSCLIICGGAILDFLGGKVSRAPKFLRGLGFEWAYRLTLEPRRMFNRYVIGNPVFLWRTLCIAWLISN